MDANRPVKIQPDQLSPDALRGVVEEFVSRDGTEMTDVERKVQEVSALLERGDVELWFDPETGTCNIVPV